MIPTYVFLIFILLLSIKKCYSNLSNKLSSEEDYNSSIESIKSIMVKIFRETLADSMDKLVKKNINKEDINELEICKKEYEVFMKNDSYSQNLSTYYAYLLYYESSKSQNDLDKYIDCLENQNIYIDKISFSPQEKQEIKDNTTFAFFKIIEKRNKSFTNISIKDDEYIFGLCIKKGCSINAIKKLFAELNQELVLFDNLQKSDVFAYDIHSNDDIKSYNIIPLCIIIIIALMNPIYFFLKRFSFKNKNKLIEFLEVFDFNINSKYILKEDEENKSSLNIINGVRGIILISIAISISFFYIYHSPVKVFNQIFIEKLLNSYGFPLLYHGEIFGKKILYAISGYELAFKMLCYLDDCIKNKAENIILKNINNNEEKGDNEKTNQGKINEDSKNLLNENIIIEKEKNFQINDNDDEDDEEEDKKYLNNYFSKSSKISKRIDENLENEEEEEEEVEKIDKNEKTKNEMMSIKSDLNILKGFNNKDPFEIINENYYEENRKNMQGQILIIWYFKQFYKYILFILAIFIFKYGTIYTFLILINPSPIRMLYVENIIKKFTFSKIMANILCYSPFSYATFHWIDPFCLVYNEIIFFLIGSALIYFCFKYCIRLDIIILISFILLFALKIILGIFVFLDLNYYPAMFYQYDDQYIPIRSYISSNQFMSLHLFLLGIFFGEIHYCIFNEESKKNRKYLAIPNQLTGLFKSFFLNQRPCQTLAKYFILLIFLGGYIAVILIFQLFINSFMNDKNNNNYYTFFDDKNFNIISLFDSDIGVMLFLFIIIIMIFFKDNIFSKFLQHKYWKILSTPFWSNLLLMHICASFIFYFTENKIKLDIYSIIFCSFQLVLLLVFISCVVFVLIEFPFKKMFKNIIKYQLKQIYYKLE